MRKLNFCRSTAVLGVLALGSSSALAQTSRGQPLAQKLVCLVNFNGAEETKVVSREGSLEGPAGKLELDLNRVRDNIKKDLADDGRLSSSVGTNIVTIDGGDADRNARIDFAARPYVKGGEMAFAGVVLTAGVAKDLSSSPADRVRTYYRDGVYTNPQLVSLAVVPGAIYSTDSYTTSGVLVFSCEVQ